MDQILLDKQPNVAATGIVGALTLTKTGTTARTATFPDASITVARTDAAQTFTGIQTVTNGLISPSTRATTSSGYLVYNANNDLISSLGVGNSTNSLFAGGVNCQALGCTTIVASGIVTVPNGTAATPGIKFTSDNFGFYREGTNQLGVSLGGVRASYYLPSAGGGVGCRFILETIAADEINTFGCGANTGATALSGGVGAASGGNVVAYGTAHTKASTVEIRVASTAVCTVTATGITATQPLTVPNGTAAAPGLRLTSEASGLYRVSATSLGFAVAGTAIANLTTAAVLTLDSGASGAALAVGTTAGSSGAINVYRNTVPSIAMHSGGGGIIRLQQANGATATLQVTDSTGATVYASVTPTTVTCTASTASTSTSTGALVVTGGAGFGGAIYVGSILNLPASAATTVAGNLQRETNQDTHYAYSNGIGGWLDKCLFSQYATVTQSGIVTDQSLASATARGTRTLPANFFKLGKVLKFRLCGRYTTDAAAGNATVQIKLGSTVFRTTGSFALDNSSTALPWTIEGEIVCQSTGATGTVEGVSVWEHMISGATGNWNAENLGGTAAVTIDTTASQAFDVIWTATDAGTTITCTCFRLWEVC